jgi:hypothetical protein
MSIRKHVYEFEGKKHVLHKNICWLNEMAYWMKKSIALLST